MRSSYGMRAPAALDPADYPLAGTGKAGDLFPWEAVVDDRNVEGATAVAVPGVVDGMGRMHERFGRMPWRDLLAPAIGFAREGLHVDWYAALIIASATRALARDPDAVAQLSSFVADYGLTLEEAFHHPRIDVSGGDAVVADDSLPRAVIDTLAREHPVARARRTVFPYAFACPAGVMRRGAQSSGCTEIMSPWGDAILEPEDA